MPSATRGQSITVTTKRAAKERRRTPFDLASIVAVRGQVFQRPARSSRVPGAREVDQGVLTGHL